jgi:four helix bundle protein
MAKFAFEKLDVWNLPVDFTLNMYEATNSFPAEEKYGLTSQIRRAAVSISSNLAEGSSRNTPKDQRRFYNIAYSTSIEVMNQLIIANKLNYILENEYLKLRKELEQITRMINSFHNATKK